MAVFLRANGARFKPRLIDMQDKVIALADGSLSFDELVDWIEKQL